MGLLRPNAIGLFDICGNLIEWCQDTYAKYPDGDNVAEDEGIFRATDSTGIIRGGSFDVRGSSLVSYRRIRRNEMAYPFSSFRVVKTIPFP